MSSGDCYPLRPQASRGARAEARADLKASREAAQGKVERAQRTAAAMSRDTTPAAAASAGAAAQSGAGTYDPSAPYGPTWKTLCPPGWPPEVYTYTSAASQRLIEEVHEEIAAEYDVLPQIYNVLLAVSVVTGAEGGRFFLPQSQFDVRPLERGGGSLKYNTDTAGVPRSLGSRSVTSTTRVAEDGYRSAIGPLQILPRTLGEMLRRHKPGWQATSDDANGVWAWDARLTASDQYQWLVVDHVERVKAYVALGVPLYYIGAAIHLNNLQGSTGDKLLAGATGDNAVTKQMLTGRLRTANASDPGNWAYIASRGESTYTQYANQFTIVRNKWRAQAGNPTSPFYIESQYVA